MARVRDGRLAALLLWWACACAGAAPLPETPCRGPGGVLRPAGTVCRAAAGPCDLAEVCSGTSPDCPADLREEKGAIGQACCAGGLCAAPGAICAAQVCVEAVACVAGGACPQVAIQGDPVSSFPQLKLRGQADPSVRRALDGSRLYLAYSWPTAVATSPPTLAIETHLAESVDDGAHWSFVQRLFGASGAEAVPGSAEAGVPSSEEISLVPAPLDRGRPELPYWVSVRERYHRPLGGALDYATYHLRVGVVQSASPAGLAAGAEAEQVILYKNSGAAFRAALGAGPVELTPLLAGTAQADCDYPVSPALAYDRASGWLYLVLECYVAGAPQAAAAQTSLIVLRTAPYAAGAVRPPAAWTWEYRGRFASSAEAALLQVHGIPNYTPNMFLQPDLAWGADGTLLLIATPTLLSAAGQARTGCQVLELEAIDPPALRKRGGELVRRALVDAPDLDATRESFGGQTGGCGYEPTARRTGLLLPRKTTDAAGVITSALFDSGVHE